MDYGKYKYEKGRKDREAHKKQKTTEIKGVRLRPSIGKHDLDTKKNRMLEFLESGNKVKVTVIFRSREFTHPEIARNSLKILADAAQDIAVVEKAASFEGRTMTMVLSPRAADARDAKVEKKGDSKKPAREEKPPEEQSGVKSDQDNAKASTEEQPKPETAPESEQPAAAGGQEET